MIATPALLFPESVTKLLQPLRIFHQEWVDARLEKLTFALTKFKETPAALAGCFAGAVVVQTILVAFREVDDALVGVSTAREQAAAQELVALRAVAGGLL